MIDLKLDVLEASMETTRTALRGGVLSINIWDKTTGLSLLDWQGNPTAVALLSQMTIELENTLSGANFPGLRDYYYIDLKDNKSLVVFDHGDNMMQGWLLDSTKTNPGVLLGLAIPKALANFEAAKPENKPAAGDSETQLNLILAASKMGLWDMIVDAGNPVSPKNDFTWTPEFRAMLGFTDENDFPNVLESWSNRLHPSHHDITLAAFAAHLTDHSGETEYDVEYQLQRKSGEYRWYRATGETTRDANGVPLRVVGVLRDIQKEREKTGNNEWVNHQA